MSEELTFFEKTHGRWNEIFNEFGSERLKVAMANPGKHCPSPINLASQKNGFRLDKDFNIKGGLGFDNSLSTPTISGINIIANITGQDTKTVTHQIHKFIDGNQFDTFAIREEIKQHQELQKNKDLEKLEFNRNLIKDILKQPVDNKFRDEYLKHRGLEQAISILNNDIRSIPNLYFDKKTTLPAMVSVVRNEDNKIAFLHRTFLDEKGNKANVENVKKVTGKTREDAYQRPYFAQVNNPKNLNSKTINIAEGIETALAVALITKNSDKVISAINANGLTRYKPPQGIKNINIWADNDSKGIEAAKKLKKNLTGKIKIQVYIPKERGHDFLDEFNKNQNKYLNMNKSKNKGLTR